MPNETNIFVIRYFGEHLITSYIEAHSFPLYEDPFYGVPIYVLGNIPNIIYKAISRKTLSRTRDNSEENFMRKGVIDVVLHPSVTTYKDFEDNESHVTGRYLTTENRLYSCFDDTEIPGSKDVLLPWHAMSRPLWILCFVTWILFSGLKIVFDIYGRRKLRQKENVFANFLRNVIFYLSYMLENSLVHQDARFSVTILLASWLWAAYFINKTYLANLNGEIILSKPTFIDELDDIVANTNAVLFLQNYDVKELRKDHSKHFKLLFRRMKSSSKMSTISGLSNTGVLLHSKFNLKQFFNNKRPDGVCPGLKVYEGEFGYFKKYFHMKLSANLPTIIIDKADYLVTRYLETDQTRTFTTWKEHTYKFPIKSLIIATTGTNIYIFRKIFDLWIYGLIMTIAAFVIEYIAYCIYNRSVSIKL